MNSLLRRQLKKFFGDCASVPVDLQPFLHAVDQAYEQFDDDRRMLERALEFSSDELLQANSQMQALFDAFPDMFFRLDKDGEIRDFHSGAGEGWSFSPKQVLGKRLQDISPPRARVELSQAIDTVNRTGSPVSMEYRLHTPGEPKYYEARLLPLPRNEIFVIVRNITERKRAEEEVRRAQLILEEAVQARTVELQASNESLRMLAAAVEQVTESLIITDGELSMPGPRILFVNPAFTAMTGYSAQEVLGKTPRILQGPGSKKEILRVLKEKLSRGESFHGELVNYKKDGSEYIAELRLAPIRNASGAVTHFVGVQRDVTREKFEEAQLRESEDRFRTFMNNLAGIAFLKDADGRYIWVNKPLEDTFGLYAGEWLGSTDFDNWPAEVAQVFRENDNEVLRTGSTATFYESVPWEGETRIWFVLKFPYFDSSGRQLLGGAGIEITELNRAEEALKASEERFRALSASAPVGIFEAGTDGGCTYVNPKLSEIAGIRLESALGDGWFNAIHPEDRDAVSEHWRLFVSGDGQFSDEFRFQKPDGSIRWVQVFASAIVFGDKITGYVGTAVDTTDRKQFELDLARARDEAVAASRQKAQFLANMSHEIRTPMNGIIGMTGILLDTPLTAQQKEFAATIRGCGEMLLTIINDILDFSKIEAGKLEFEMLDFDLQEIVEGTLELMAERAQAKGIELSSFMEPEAVLAVRGDSGRLRQILTNLVGNAIKFTEKGAVTVSVCRTQTLDRYVEVKFEIKDTGIGLSQESIGRLFRAFSQADSSTTRKYGGTGLGLAICAQLVTLMRGAIGVDSAPGEGSTFWFTVQLEIQNQSGKPSLVQEGAKLPRLLIVSDNPYSRDVLLRIVQSWEMPVSSVSEPLKAIEMLRASVGTNPYDAVLLDLTDADGGSLVLAKSITGDPTLASTRVVLFSYLKYSFSDLVLKAAGISARLLKPVRQSQLFEYLMKPQHHQFGENSEVNRSPLAAPPLFGPDTPKIRVLLAEDNIVNQRVAVAQLRKLGLTADCVANGLEVIQSLAQIGYDVVLMDCHMPEMDGFEATEQIRTLYRERNIYIIAMTANAIRGDREECIAAGMNDYLSKPVKIEDLREAICRGVQWIGCRTEQASHNRLVLDPHKLQELQLLADPEDHNFVSDLLRAFIDDAETQIESLREAIKEGKPENVQRIAHTIAGESLNIGACSIGHLGRRLQQMGRENNLSEAGEVFRELLEEFEKVRMEVHTVCC
jgi:PAS domain S-box-containing protein